MRVTFRCSSFKSGRWPVLSQLYGAARLNWPTALANCPLHWECRYDPDKDMGFDEHEECCVTFLEDRECPNGRCSLDQHRLLAGACSSCRQLVPWQLASSSADLSGGSSGPVSSLSSLLPGTVYNRFHTSRPLVPVPCCPSLLPGLQATRQHSPLTPLSHCQSADYLWDLGQDEELPWRQVGHTWEPPPPLAGDGAAEGAEVFSLADLAADIETRER